MLWIDQKYAKLSGSSISLFSIKKTSPFLATGRCPICGDSKKSTRKCRFFFIENSKDQTIVAKCHNCGYAGNISMFLQKTNTFLYEQYIFERFKSQRVEVAEEQSAEHERLFTIKNKIVAEKKEEMIDKQTLFYTLPSVWDLPDDHSAKVYWKARKIPRREFLYCKDFHKFASNFNDDFKEKRNEHARIIIPFRDRSGTVYAFQARALGNEIPKYYTTIIDKERPKYYNFDNVNPEKLIYIVEGPVDSLYIPNCIAALSSALLSAAAEMQKILNNNPDNYVLVYDNEPRNYDVVKLQEKAINEGYKTVIWDDEFLYKDINKAVEQGMCPREIFKKIQSCTYSGLEARLRFSKWKKVKEFKQYE